jgi:hypothetical protein
MCSCCMRSFWACGTGPLPRASTANRPPVRSTQLSVPDSGPWVCAGYDVFGLLCHYYPQLQAANM